MRLSWLRQQCAGGITTLGLVALLALSACHRARQDPGSRQIVVQLSTVGDTAPSQAYVSVRADDDTALVELSTEGSGRYAARIPRAAERATLRVVMPQHATIVARLWLPARGSAEFRIRPRALVPYATVDAPTVIGDFNNFKEYGGVPLRPTNHGTLRAAIAFHGDSCRFQILGIGAGARSPWIPVPSLALVKVDGAQTFAGVMKPVNDSLIFEVDTTRRATNLRPPSIVTITRDSSLALANSLVVEREDLLSFRGWVQAFLPADSQLSRSAAIERAKHLMTASTDPRVRGEAVVSVLALWQSFSDIAAGSSQFFAVVPPGSSVLRDQSGAGALMQALFLDVTPPDTASKDAWRRRKADRARAYALPIARNAANDSNPRINAYLSLVRTLDVLHDEAGADKVISEAVAAFPKNPFIAPLPRAMGSGKILRVGASFPSFHLTALDGTHSELSNDIFTGKLTLVDFWGTWCSPCVAELPSMHKAFEVWKDKGFSILSVSSDESIDAVQRFRREKLPMPWMHSWSGAGLNTPALRALGVVSFPTAVLVDGAGRIVAMDGAVRGDSLQLTLAKYLH